MFDQITAQLDPEKLEENMLQAGIGEAPTLTRPDRRQSYYVLVSHEIRRVLGP